jgi:hypothetical protein
VVTGAKLRGGNLAGCESFWGVELRGGFPVDWPPHESEAPEGALYFISRLRSLMEFEVLPASLFASRIAVRLMKS